MTQLIHKIFLLLCILSCSTSTFAATASEAEYKKLSKSWTLNADGSQEFRYNMELTIYTYTAMRSMYGESFITYNPKYQTLKINSSYTKQKDGSIVKTPDNAFVEVLPSSAVNAPYYNKLTEMVIVHTGLELGATIYLDYTLTTKAGYLPELDIMEPIEQSSPVKEYNISISVPEGDDLFYGIHNRNEKAKVSVNNGKLQASWSLKNLPAASRAPYQRSDNSFLMATTYPSQKEAVKAIYAQMETKESMPLLSLAETVTAGKNSDEEKVQAILSFVHNDFAHSALSLEETGYMIRPVEDVINSAYGTETELVNLMQGLLNALKIKAEVCAFYPINNPDNRMGLKPVRFFVKADAGNQTWLLNPNTESMDNAGWMANRGFVVEAKSGNSINLSSVNADMKYDVEMTWKDNKVTSSIKADISRALINYTDTKATAFTAGDSKASVRISGETAHLEFTCPATASTQNGISMVALLDAPKGMSHSAYVHGNTTRDCNLILPYAANETYSYSVQVPAGKSCITASVEKNISNAAGSIQISIQNTGGKVTVKRSLKLHSATIAKANYPAFHALLATWVNPNYTMLMFKDK